MGWYYYLVISSKAIILKFSWWDPTIHSGAVERSTQSSFGKKTPVVERRQFGTQTLRLKKKSLCLSSESQFAYRAKVIQRPARWLDSLLKRLLDSIMIDISTSIQFNSIEFQYFDENSIPGLNKMNTRQEVIHPFLTHISINSFFFYFVTSKRWLD